MAGEVVAYAMTQVLREDSASAMILYLANGESADMGSWSIGHWIVVLLVILLLFGAGKIPRLMGDMARGVKAFKKGMKEDEETGTTTGLPLEFKALEEQTSCTAEMGKDRIPRN